MLWLILSFVALIFMDIIFSWLIYVHRGSAQPDNPSKKDYPIITGPGDALSHKTLDSLDKDP